MSPTVESPSGDTRTLRVDRVARDRLVSIATTGRPIDAIAELIWNGLDADATRIELEFRRHQLGGIAAIEINDNGSGIPRDLAQSQFRRIGGSWKRKSIRSAQGRMLHGKEGQGRLRAFALGDRVRWTSCRDEEGERRVFDIAGTREALDRFELGATKVLKRRRRPTGTRVRIDNVPEAVRGLESPQSRASLEKIFAGYLQQYPEIEIVYDGQALDRNRGVARTDELQLYFSGADGEEHVATMRIIEWERAVARRSLFFCDDKGNALHEERAAIQAPHFEFTAYIGSPRIAELARIGALDFEGLHPETRALLAAVRESLREHFRQRSEAEARDRLERWRGAQVYPYEHEAVSEVEEVEREVFDVCARQIEASWPQFAVQAPATRRLVFELLRRALESPEGQTIESSLTRGLGLSEDKSRELVQAVARLEHASGAGPSRSSARRNNPKARAAALDSHWARWCEGDADDASFAKDFDLRASSVWPQLEQMQRGDGLEAMFRSAVETDGSTLESPRRGWFQAPGEAGGLWRVFASGLEGDEVQARAWLILPGLAGETGAGQSWIELGHRLAEASMASEAPIRPSSWRVEVLATQVSPGLVRATHQAMRPAGMLYMAGDARLEVWVRSWPEACKASGHGI